MTPTNDASQEGGSAGGPRHGPGVGTVAEEAARLVEILSSYGSGSRPDRAEPNGGADQNGRPAAESPPASERQCTCGGSRPAACAVCPVCQLIAFVQSINPDTIDRLADAVELAATGLRDLATVQRDRRGARDDRGPS